MTAWQRISPTVAGLVIIFLKGTFRLSHFWDIVIVLRQIFDTKFGTQCIRNKISGYKVLDSKILGYKAFRNRGFGRKVFDTKFLDTTFWDTTFWDTRF